ncbi:MAG TPA: DNA-processing protein DprA [Candidatus Paceibacterota bacterium]|mgnify:CR=1 FL=1|jgi:DNA processing protein|nr:DNA-processing protein DprA [Candidatus Paceibacterota bacterium]
MIKDFYELKLTDPDYPKLLKEITNPPSKLYIKGTLLKDELCLAVVGTRKPTSYGIEACKYFTRELANLGFTIVSGLALGIDSISHQIALENNCRTIAVLGSGLNKISPSSNSNLALKIAKQGAIISEFEPDEEALPYNFPQRNRIIAGLAIGTLVIEASEKSGALITARLATENNREVFAVPGSIFSIYSKGTNKLIAQGAKLVSSPIDILEEFYWLKEKIKEKTIQDLSVDEIKILESLTEPKTIEELSLLTNLEIGVLKSILTEMELKNLILKRLDGLFQKTND